MHIIIDFSTNEGQGKIFVLQRWHGGALVLGGIATVIALAYILALSIVSQWAKEEESIVGEIVEYEQKQVEANRNRLWEENVLMLQDSIADNHVRINNLYQQGEMIADYLGLQTNSLFSEVGKRDDFYTAQDDNSLWCNLDSERSLPEQSVELSSILLEQQRTLTDLEQRFTVLTDQGIYRHVLADTVPLERPVIGKHWLVSNYGYRRDPFTGRRAFHSGMDFAARKGTSVVAAASGIVIHEGRFGNYGKAILLHHGNEISTLYGHLSQINVDLWQYVTRGEEIGAVGSTGRSTGPHLHYEVRLNNRPQPVLTTIRKLRKKQFFFQSEAQ